MKSLLTVLSLVFSASLLAQDAVNPIPRCGMVCSMRRDPSKKILLHARDNGASVNMELRQGRRVVAQGVYESIPTGNRFLEFGSDLDGTRIKVIGIMSDEILMSTYVMYKSDATPETVFYSECEKDEYIYGVCRIRLK